MTAAKGFFFLECLSRNDALLFKGHLLTTTPETRATREQRKSQQGDKVKSRERKGQRPTATQPALMDKRNWGELILIPPAWTPSNVLSESAVLWHARCASPWCSSPASPVEPPASARSPPSSGTTPPSSGNALLPPSSGDAPTTASTMTEQGALSAVAEVTPVDPRLSSGCECLGTRMILPSKTA